MTAQPDTEVFSRLVEILLPRGGYVMAIYEAYIDESGELDSKSRIFCVAGYLARSDQAMLMKREWDAILADHELPYFHMVDCAHGNNFFKGFSKRDRSEIAKRLIELIKKYTALGFSAIVNPKRHDQHNSFDAYSFCLDICMGAMTHIKADKNDKVALFFESGHKNESVARKGLEERGLPENCVSYTFAKKGEVRLLEAADLLAWQCTRHLKNKVFENRAPRKDFLNLMSHKHHFNYIFFKENGSFTVDYDPAKENKRRDSYLKALFSEGKEHDQALEEHHKTFSRKWEGGKIVPNNNSGK